MNIPAISHEIPMKPQFFFHNSIEFGFPYLRTQMELQEAPKDATADATNSGPVRRDAMRWGMGSHKTWRFHVSFGFNLISLDLIIWSGDFMRYLMAKMAVL